MNLTKLNHQKKIEKRLRNNHILEGLRETKTCQELEILHGVTKNYYSHAITRLADEGYVTRVGYLGKASMWKSLYFDYREHGVDYDLPPCSLPPVTGKTTLADAVYRHSPDDFRDKHNETSALLRRERKSARVYVSGAQSYASF